MAQWGAVRVPRIMVLTIDRRLLCGRRLEEEDMDGALVGEEAGGARAVNTEAAEVETGE